MNQPDPQKLQAFAGSLAAAFEAIDWPSLGEEYCESGGDEFFTEEAVEALQDAGLLIASDLEDVLFKTKSKNSLYVGIGVAEVVPILFETILLERKVHAVTLPGPEQEQLQKAFKAAKKRCPFPLPQIDTRPLAPSDKPECSHLWLASVITDPEAFPALHDQLYKRQGTRQATGRGNIHKERKRAHALFATAISWLKTPAVITTSQEELPILEKALGSLAITLKVPEKGRLSPIVGDPLIHCNWGA